MSLLERCPYFRGCYVQASMELEPEDVPIRGREGGRAHSQRTVAQSGEHVIAACSG